MTDASESGNEFKYFETRLQHTVSFTHEATKNIYLVNGAVLAMISFVSQGGPHVNTTIEQYGPPILLVILAFVNSMHALMLYYQGKWYRILDAGFAEASGIRRPAFPARFGTHRVFVLLHLGLAIIVFIAGIALWGYGADEKYESLPNPLKPPTAISPSPRPKA